MGEAQQPAATVVEPPARSGWSMALWGLLALVAHLALLDAAVETIWSGSPLRWWISPGLLLVAALSVWSWRPGGKLLRRFGPAAAAATPVLLFLAVLAVTAWLPSGQSNGLCMFLQSTPRVLTAVLGGAVLLAAFVLVRAVAGLGPTPRLVARAVVVGLAVYALAAAVIALRGDVPFASAFQGGALWQRLPYWLQGTFVGGAVLVPVAVLGALVSIAGSLRRHQPVRALVHQAMALTMAFVMTVSGLVLSGPSSPGVAGGQAATTVSKPAPLEATPMSIDALKSEWTKGQDPVKFAEQIFTAAKADLEKPGADPSNIGAMAATLGHDRQRVFVFLRDRIVLEPYAGMLRGARGTLAAGAGNSLDRALLAQALLKASGIESRLVAGSLPNDTARALLARYLARDALPAPLADLLVSPDAARLDANARSSATALGLPVDKAVETARRNAAHMEAFWRWTEDQSAAQLRFVTGELSRAGVKGAGVTPRWLERLTKHYWVQVKDASGAWSDFDPSLPEAAGTVAASDPRPLNAVPREEIHRATISLVLTAQVGRESKRDVLLEGDVASADALFAPAQFEIDPGDASFDPQALLGMERGRAIEALRNIKRFQPVLRVGPRVISGKAFDLEGNTYDADSGQRPRASAGDLFGGLFGGEGEATGPRRFEELQLVVRVSGPGRAPRVQTRTLLRAADIGKPAYAPPLMWSEILIQPQWLGMDFVAHQALQALVAGRRTVTDAMQASRDGKPLRMPSQASARFPRHLMELALLRQRATAGILRAQPGLRALVDAPLVTMAHEQLSALDPASGVMRLRSSIDIMANDVRFIDRSGGASQATFDAALRQGVADCTLETAVVQDLNPERAALSGTLTFQAAAAERRPIVVAAARDTEALRRAGVSEPDLAWIRAGEDPASRLVIASTPAGSAAWWSVAEDGTTVLRVSGGWGQGMTEHQFMNVMKSIAGADCLFREVTHAKHHPNSSAAVWGAASCLVLTTASFTMMLMHVHGVVCTLMLTVEILNVVGTAIAADGERTRVIVAR